MSFNENLTVAVLMPTYDELGETIDLSLLNLALRMKEVQNIAWILMIGVNGTEKEEDVAKVRQLVSQNPELDQANVQVNVLHYREKGKEKAMNQLAAEAQSITSHVDLFIGTDVKVYRTPGSFGNLITEFQRLQGDIPHLQYLGATILPYDIDTYEQYYDLSDQQKVFYTLLEIDKDEDVRRIFPKNHLRGGLYITQNWTELSDDLPDDFTMTIKTRLQHGEDSVQLTEESIGYVIPRLSYADYFAVRFKRSLPHEKTMQETLPKGTQTQEMRAANITAEKLEQLRAISPEKHALFCTKKELDKLTRELANDIQAAPTKLDQLLVLFCERNGELPASMSLDTVLEIALSDPKDAALMITLYYRGIVDSLSREGNSVSFGPREAKFRSMLPLDLPINQS